MDENLPVNSGNPREDSFDTAVRGYNRVQVQEYMARSNKALSALEQHLRVAQADAERARSEADSAHSENERLRESQAEAKPVHQEVSSRLSQILKLAAEEADQERATADAEIVKLRAESKAEAEALIAQARAEAEQEVAEAHATAERELSEARARAERDLSSAREEAERLRVVSVRQADELLDEAQRRSGAINEVSSQRLETLTATHGEAVLRLGQIRDVLADLLDRDAAAGSLAQVVEAVIAPPAVGGELDDELESGPNDPLTGDLPPALPADDEDELGRRPQFSDKQFSDKEFSESSFSDEPVPAPETPVAPAPVAQTAGDHTELQSPVETTAVQSAVTDETREFYADSSGEVTEAEVVDVRDEKPGSPSGEAFGLRGGVPSRR